MNLIEQSRRRKERRAFAKAAIEYAANGAAKAGNVLLGWLLQASFAALLIAAAYWLVKHAGGAL